MCVVINLFLAGPPDISSGSCMSILDSNISNSCCMPFRDATDTCRPPGSSCYCDSLCLERGDCCEDFVSTLPPIPEPCVPCKSIHPEANHTLLLIAVLVVHVLIVTRLSPVPLPYCSSTSTGNYCCLFCSV